MNVRAFIDRCSHPWVRGLMMRLDASPLGVRLLRGAFWSLMGSLIARALGLVAAIAVGRLIGRLEFGELGVVQNTVAMFGVLAGFGMGVTANKYVAEFKHSDPARAGRVLSMSVSVAWIASGAMAALLFLTAPWVARHLLLAPQLEHTLKCGALLLFLSGISGAQNGALAGFEAFKDIARIALWTGVLSFPVTVVAASLAGLSGAMWALVFTQALSCLLNHLAVRRMAAACGIRPTLAGALQEMPLFWRFSLPAVLSGLVAAVATWASNVFVVQQHGGYADMGVFNAVMRVKAVPELLVAMLLAPVLPVLSEAFGSGDRRSFQSTLVSSSMLAIGILLPVSLVQTAAPSLTMALFGTEYEGHPEIVQWLMLNAVLYALLYSMGTILISTGSMWLASSLNLAYSIIHVTAAWLLVPVHGAAGLAASMVIAYVLANIPSVIILFRRFPEMMKALRFGLLVTGSLALFALCVLASRTLSLPAALGVGLVAAILCLAGDYWLCFRPRTRPF